MRLSDRSATKTDTTAYYPVMRGLVEQYGPKKEEVGRWETDKLECKYFTKDDYIYNKMLGFFTDSKVFDVFQNLWAYVAATEGASPEVDESYFRMNFKITYEKSLVLGRKASEKAEKEEIQ